ncbi:MAG: hypothetical protein JWO05_2300 [Gemmatimonadetes bacterium]|nr:hypothetical protein [Gemmatimonadota bacterium]
MRVADYAVGARGDMLSTLGLGSCVAIVLYDADAAVGGLAHILLPDAALARDAGNPAKFPSTVVPLMLREMQARGARQSRVRARIAGGASMFANLIPKGGVNVGERNVAATRAALADAGIPLDAEDTGADHGRSVFFSLDSGSVEVRSLKRGTRVL